MTKQEALSALKKKIDTLSREISGPYGVSKRHFTLVQSQIDVLKEVLPLIESIEVAPSGTINLSNFLKEP